MTRVICTAYYCKFNKRKKCTRATLHVGGKEENCQDWKIPQKKEQGK